MLFLVISSPCPNLTPPLMAIQSLIFFICKLELNPWEAPWAAAFLMGRRFQGQHQTHQDLEHIPPRDLGQLQVRVSSSDISSKHSSSSHGGCEAS